MIIISYGDFMDEVQPLTDWKIINGTPCTVVDIAGIGRFLQYKEFIENAYNFSGLTFVLLVGDDAQVPSSIQVMTQIMIILMYVGNDHYPDLFVGRFSAADRKHDVTTWLTVQLTYEKTH